MTKNDSAIAIVGGGVAGLICACKLIELGYSVTLLDHAKKLGQKWLLASSSGMNFSVNATPQTFAKVFGEHSALFEEFYASFGSREFNDWLQKWGFSLKKGNGTRLFAEGGTPKELLAKVIDYLAHSLLCIIHTNCKVTSLTQEQSAWKLQTSCGEIMCEKVIFACGGKSYPKTGSDGSWVDLLEPFGFTIHSFKSSNCAFKVNWSNKMQLSSKYQYIKNVSIDGTRGDLVLTPFGIEGSPVYPHSSKYRSNIEETGIAFATIDLFPDVSLEQLLKKLENGGMQGKKSFSSWLKSRTSLSNEAFSLFMECTSIRSAHTQKDLALLASTLKSLQIPLVEPAPIEKAISSAGGISLNDLTENLESKNYAGLFFCGEMLDIDPPTGGYLIQTCFTTANVIIPNLNREP